MRESQESDMNQEILNALLSSSDAVVILIDSDGRVEFINQAGLDLLGLPLAVVRNRYFWEIAILPEQVESITNEFKQAIAVGISNLTTEVPWKLANGEVRWLRWTTSTVSLCDGADGQRTQILTIGIDITSSKRANDELTLVKNQLQIALDAGQISVWEIDIEAGDFHFLHQETASPIDRTLSSLDLHRLMAVRFGPDREADVVSKLANFQEQSKNWKEGDKIIDAVQHSIQGYSQTGSPQWVQSSGRIAKNAQGRLSIVGISSNITKQKQSELALKEEQAFSTALLNAIETLIFVVDADGIILRINQTCQEILGYSPQELEGALFCDLMSRPERRDEVHSKFASCFESSRTIYQDQLVSKPGELRWVRWRVAPIQLDNGEAQRLVISGHDVTDEVLANQLVKESEARFRAMAEHIDSVLFIGDIHSTSIQYVSPVYERMFGLSCESLLADAGSFLSVVHPQDIEYVKTVFHQGPSYVPITGEYRILKADNEIRWVRYQTFPVLDSSGVPYQIIGMIEDITEEKQTYNVLEERVAQRTQDLADANQQLLQANRLRDEFLANMSHELRTPLNSILLKVELLKECLQGPLTKRQRHSLDVVQESSNHLLSMLTDMLDLATSEVEMLSLNLSVVSLQKICEASMNEIQELADKRQVRLSHNWPQTDIFVYGDTRRIGQILVHLLSNAVKFTPNGGDIGIDMAIDQEMDMVQLTVWDTGQGIGEKNIPMLFQPFVQLEGGLNRKYEGPGIGLALVKRLVLLHRGQISVKSQIGKGSRFIITLPYRLDQTTNQPSENAYVQQY